MTLSKDNLINETVEYRPAKRGGRVVEQPWHVWTYRCSTPGCSRLIKLRKGNLATATGRCKVCNNRKRPYEWLYTVLRCSATYRSKPVPVELTYEEFLTFTAVPICHYCDSPLEWSPHQTTLGVKSANKVNLDRKDNSKGYSLDNCVPCCQMCNFLRQDKLTYEEFCCLKEGLRKVAQMRRRDGQAKERA